MRDDLKLSNLQVTTQRRRVGRERENPVSTADHRVWSYAGVKEQARRGFLSMPGPCALCCLLRASVDAQVVRWELVRTDAAAWTTSSNRNQPPSYLLRKGGSSNSNKDMEYAQGSWLQGKHIGACSVPFPHLTRQTVLCRRRCLRLGALVGISGSL